MQDKSSLEASRNTVKSSDAVTLAVDADTAGKLRQAVERLGEWGCAIMEHSDD